MYDSVKDYYGKVLQGSDDLKTNACCTGAALPAYIRSALSDIHDEVLTRYYGCGLIAPQQLKGCHILDLGSGSGRDCFVLSRLVGEEGSVVGIDMTSEQLDVANRHIDYHMDRYGYKQPNVRFLEGYLERLHELDLPDNSFDIIVSNCVINLSPDKPAVLREALRLLKPGGELYFSDVYASRRVPTELLEDPVLYGECLSGALYWNDFIPLAKQTGFLDPRLVESSPITIENSAIEEKIGHIDFWSATWRLFKLPELESACEDYGQAVIYKGTIEHCPKQFVLDNHHAIETGKVFPVCGNTWQMLHETRFREHFKFIGDMSTHYGIFADCGTPVPFEPQTTPESSGGCC
ncbi:methyltransferase domain-containing protein [Kistimonas asteriae]|uniref:methyltransferase domain-containing protein n=1 Tax=Kistimonas asteriae TaxID=517724 RepID=UPI001BA79242|nr:methyltransferase domain-containing protein [Kistimonas asteriae]